MLQGTDGSNNNRGCSLFLLGAGLACMDVFVSWMHIGTMASCVPLPNKTVQVAPLPSFIVHVQLPLYILNGRSWCSAGAMMPLVSCHGRQTSEDGHGKVGSAPNSMQSWLTTSFGAIDESAPTALLRIVQPLTRCRCNRPRRVPAGPPLPHPRAVTGERFSWRQVHGGCVPWLAQVLALPPHGGRAPFESKLHLSTGPGRAPRCHSYRAPGSGGGTPGFHRAAAADPEGRTSTRAAARSFHTYAFPGSPPLQSPLPQAAAVAHGYSLQAPSPRLGSRTGDMPPVWRLQAHVGAPHKE